MCEVGRSQWQSDRPRWKARLQKESRLSQYVDLKTSVGSARYLDVAGVATSALCVVHCVITPLLVGVLAASGVRWLRNEVSDWVILSASLAIGLSSLVPAYRHVHRSSACLGLFCCGMLSILAGRFAERESLRDLPFMIFGAVLISSAHAMNHYFCRRCRRCGVHEIQEIEDNQSTSASKREKPSDVGIA